MLMLIFVMQTGDQAEFKVSQTGGSSASFYQVLSRGSVVASGNVDLASGKLR